jgi:hypothetical protein
MPRQCRTLREKLFDPLASCLSKMSLCDGRGDLVTFAAPGTAGETFNRFTAPVSSKHPIGRIDLCINSYMR